MTTSPARRLRHWMLALLLGTCAAVQAAAQTTYRIVQLSADPYTAGFINAKGQVAFTESSGGELRAKFYDGRRVRDMGNLGGPGATVTALNDHGQATGYSLLSSTDSVQHAFIWHTSTGMADLSPAGSGDSVATDINNRGQIAGIAGGMAFRWSRDEGLRSLGSFGAGSYATALNAAGTVVGVAPVLDPNGDPLGLPFRWTAAQGMVALSYLGNQTTSALDINNAGHIVGTALFEPGGGAQRAFLWTPRQGLLDLGAGSGNFSSAHRINAQGMVIGALSNFPEYQHGFIWTRADGFLEIGGPDAAIATTRALNDHGQVVGGIDGRAYVWTRSGGIVYLDERLSGAPAGLVLLEAHAISDNGAIVANANTGLVLLVPQEHCD